MRGGETWATLFASHPLRVCAYKSSGLGGVFGWVVGRLALIVKCRENSKASAIVTLQSRIRGEQES